MVFDDRTRYTWGFNKLSLDCFEYFVNVPYLRRQWLFLCGTILNILHFKVRICTDFVTPKQHFFDPKLAYFQAFLIYLKVSLSSQLDIFLYNFTIILLIICWRFFYRNWYKWWFQMMGKLLYIFWIIYQNIVTFWLIAKTVEVFVWA